MVRRGVCLYSSYFMQSSLPFFVRFYLEQLRPHFERIVFISNDDRDLDSDSVQWLADGGIELLLVRNEGYDFGMWQKALRALGDVSGLQRLCLSNDSCICFAPLSDFFGWAEAGGYEAAGLIQSKEQSLHLQSYLMVFSGRAVSLISDHILSLKVEGNDREYIVSEGEVGLSKMLLAQGVPLSSYFDLDVDDNPSLFHCPTLIDMGMPMIKRRIFHYPQRHMIWRAVSLGRGFTRGYYIARVMRMCPEERVRISQLFADLPPRSLRAELKMWRQFLKCWIQLRLGRGSR